jgi:F-type H+-transporting ATPase subunit b
MEALTQGLQRNDIIALLLTNIVAFLIFFWVLRKYAWGPLLSMLDARREKVRSDYAAAEKELQDAEGLKAEFEAKLAEIRDLEREKVQEAVKRGEAIADRLEEEARSKADSFREKAEADLDREVRAARLGLRERTVDMALQAAELVIKEKLDERKHRQLVEDFISRLGEKSA